MTTWARHYCQRHDIPMTPVETKHGVEYYCPECAKNEAVAGRIHESDQDK